MERIVVLFSVIYTGPFTLFRFLSGVKVLLFSEFLTIWARSCYSCIYIRHFSSGYSPCPFGFDSFDRIASVPCVYLLYFVIHTGMCRFFSLSWFVYQSSFLSVFFSFLRLQKQSYGGSGHMLQHLWWDTNLFCTDLLLVHAS